MMDDSKYYKRRQQRKLKRRRILTIVAGATFVVTWVLLSLGTSQQEQGPKGETIGSRATNAAEIQLHTRNLTFPKILDSQDLQTSNNLRSAYQRIQQLRGTAKEKIHHLRDQVDRALHNDNQVIGGTALDPEILKQQLQDLEADIVANIKGGVRWVRPDLLVSLDKNKPNIHLDEVQSRHSHHKAAIFGHNAHSEDNFFHVRRLHQLPMEWERLAGQMDADTLDEASPYVDYTTHAYEYPPMQLESPTTGYPELRSLGKLLGDWPQDSVDNPPSTIREVLMHFDFNDPDEMETARKYREAKVPFKVINVPDVVAAGVTWSDEYVSQQFINGAGSDNRLFGSGNPAGIALADGQCQESPNNFFSFFAPSQWNVDSFGMPPTRLNDWTYSKWAKHARYSDATRLDFDRPHFYWQAGVDKEERFLPPDKWTFISRDLPSLNSKEENFFVFSPEHQKGIQCRFGERGVTAATHYDGGRNMVAMIKGAKRYILSPPMECAKLGIETTRGHTVFRHSLLNFGHLEYYKTENETYADGVSQEERRWLDISQSAMSVETVLKAGEVLYIPSHWFHYITSLQKSAQCNVRSGVDRDGSPEFGGLDDVTFKCDPLKDVA